MNPNTAKIALSNGKPLFGCWIQLFNPVVAEMMGLCGYNILMIDMEHGLGSVQDTANVMRAARGTGAASLVRLPANDPVIIKTLMDQGADGIMVPMVETPEAAQAVVSACRYPPKGNRGLAVGIARGSDYGINENYVATVDDHTLVICQIETVLGVKNARAIAEIDGVDMLFIGRNDLAADSGHILDLDHPEVNALVDEVLAIAKETGKKIGTVPSAGRTWEKLIDEGFDLVIPSSDISILRMFGQQEVGAFRAHVGDERASSRIAKGY
ncbi:5-keto-4-deoxy-D-glucarate aldolase [Ensifer adhaerens]|uniref:aldolase/citrate lyase family protein n=1 Tax=Ensifer adhaerens TaxID=106592 RepID=UPI0015691FDE|nr:5-keto-4-deoxy-D-glucarate aldolase [Ensifer adhaerens]